MALLVPPGAALCAGYGCVGHEGVCLVVGRCPFLLGVPGRGFHAWHRQTTQSCWMQVGGQDLPWTTSLLSVCQAVISWKSRQLLVSWKSRQLVAIAVLYVAAEPRGFNICWSPVMVRTWF